MNGLIRKEEEIYENIENSGKVPSHP